MTYTPGGHVVIPMVHPSGPWGLIAGTTSASASASATWPGANLAAYVPVVVPTVCVVRRLWWANGSTVSASYNIDCGIYADAGYKPGARLISTGSTAQGTASNVQFVDVTDTTLAPGQYWLALAVSSTLSTIFRINILTTWDATLAFTQASALPLPATATPAEPSWSSPAIPLCGFATTASP